MPIILSSFNDDKVGLVSSRDIWVDKTAGSPIQQHQYINYEMKIRRLESRLNSTITASGSFFAVRRDLYCDYGENQADDFALPLQVYRRGYKVIHRDDLIGYVPMVKSTGAEFSRRARIVEAGIRTVLANPGLLNPLRYPLFAWQLWSHKVLKWLFPFMVMASFVLTVLSMDSGWIYKIVFIAYLLIGLISAQSFIPDIQKIMPHAVRSLGFILISMGAVLAAWYNIITGGGVKTWEPTHR
jgi:cellulose synthase/poly-beta-1,6-N-acetylglucosamine synthase-like glycosyltransferase